MTAPDRSTRRRALEILHAADVSNSTPDTEAIDDVKVRELVEGVQIHRVEVDAAIRSAAEHWTIERMPFVDRNLLRLATFELLHSAAPPSQIVGDAVALAKLLSTEESGRFVNGLLGRIAREHPAR